MDFLLILVAIGGFVVSIVLLVLASRANRLQEESDVRVETLEALATGSVLFARVSPEEPDLEPEWASASAALQEPTSLPLFAQPEPAPLAGRVTIAEPRPRPPLAPPSLAKDPDLDLALNEFADEEELTSSHSGVEEPAVSAPQPFAVTAAGYPFVMTVPATAGTGRVQVSFDRIRTRSRT